MPAVPDLEDTVILLNLAVVGALAAASLTLVAPATTPGQDPCGAAQQQVTQQEERFRGATETVKTRAVELGITAEVIAAAEAAAADSVISDAEKQSLLQQAETSGDAKRVNLGDLLLLKAVADAQVGLTAAITTRDALCAGEAPVSPPADCDTARELGIPLPIRRGDPRFAPELDRDNDGVACEVGEGVREPLPAVIVPNGAPDTGR